MDKTRAISIALTCISTVGVIVTSVLTAKATVKATKLIEDAEHEKGEELTTSEKVKTAAPAYIPAILVGASTIACIFGIEVLNSHQQASLMSAYALLDNSYKEYRMKVKELYGDEADDRVIDGMDRDRFKEWADEIEDGEQLFFDMNTGQYFMSTVDNVIQKTVMDDGLECYIISTPYDTLPSMCIW